MKPAPATSGYHWNRFAWWLAARFPGRRIFGRLVYPGTHGEGWSLHAGKVDVTEMRRQHARAITQGAPVVKMEIEILDGDDG